MRVRVRVKVSAWPSSANLTLFRSSSLRRSVPWPTLRGGGSGGSPLRGGGSGGAVSSEGSSVDRRGESALRKVTPKAAPASGTAAKLATRDVETVPSLPHRLLVPLPARELPPALSPAPALVPASGAWAHPPSPPEACSCCSCCSEGVAELTALPVAVLPVFFRLLRRRPEDDDAPSPPWPSNLAMRKSIC